jgi:hypothetical protein
VLQRLLASLLAALPPQPGSPSQGTTERQK